MTTVTSHKRSASQGREDPPPRPTTPLRAPSRTSLRSSHTPLQYGGTSALTDTMGNLEPMFAELADSMADLEANFVHLQLVHESLIRFNECFASFLYGLNVNAFCVDFPEAPVPETFKHASRKAALNLAYRSSAQDRDAAAEGEHTFLTSDTSFVDNPPISTARKTPMTPKRNANTKTPAAMAGRQASRQTPSARGRGRGQSQPSSVPGFSTRGGGAR